MTTRCGQILHLRKYCKMMRTSKFSLAKCSWSRTIIIVCKHGCPLLMETTHMILLNIIMLKVLFWTSKNTLQLCWQPCMKSIGNSFIFIFLFVFLVGFLFLIGCLFSISYHFLFYFVMKNQKFYVSKNLVYKVFHIQSIARQLFLYFETFISKEDLLAAHAIQKSKHGTYFTLVVKALNGFLSQVFFSKFCFACFLHFLYIYICLFIWIFTIVFFIMCHISYSYMFFLV